MLATLLVALTLAQVSPTAGNSKERAWSYFHEGQDLYRKERYQRALKSFEMAATLADFAFGERQLKGQALQMASTSALFVGDPTKAVQSARAYLDWSQDGGSPVDVARASNDLLAAYLTLDNDDAIEQALPGIERAVHLGQDPEQSARFASLTAQLERPPRTVAEVTSQASREGSPSGERRAIVRRTIEPVAATTPTPAPTADGSDRTSGATEAAPLVVEPPREILIRRPTAATPTPTAAIPTPTPTAATATPTPTPTPAIPTPTAAIPTPTPAAAEAEPAGSVEPSPMVTVPTGRWSMGDRAGDADEAPLREVELGAFRLERFEVTSGQFAHFLQATGHQPQPPWSADANPTLPARGVSWNDANAYCTWAGRRLPTEAEWERAARGPDQGRYAFGDSFASTAARIGLGVDAGPAPVGSYPANAWGLHDLTGNVLEWCADWYDARSYRESVAHYPSGPTRGQRKVLRGGAWSSDEREARAANRFALPPDQASPRSGIRCAADAD